MKKILFIFCFLLATLSVFAQTGINTKSPNTNTYLHLDETTGAGKIYKGVLTSRYTTAERDNQFTGLTVAENGLLIYNITENCYNYWKHDGTAGAWVSLCGCLPGSTPGQFYVNCGGATVNPNLLTQNINTPGSITVPIVVVSPGEIEALTETINGVTFTTALTTITQSTTSFVINFTGAPSTATAIPVNIRDNNGVTICTVTIPVIPNGAQFACTSPESAAATFYGNYATGTALDASNTMTLTVNVSVPGAYGAITYTGGGMTFTAPAGSFATTGNHDIVFTGAGNPTTGGNNILKSTGLCDANVNVTQTFSYNFTCLESTPAANTIVFTQGVPKAGSFTIPIVISGTGTIPATTYINNGITYTTPEILNATDATTSLTVSYTGTATTAGTTTFNIGSCSYTFNVISGSSTYACTSGSAIQNGMIYTSTPLTNSNTITAVFNATVAGNHPELTYIGGGMTFTLAAGTFNAGNNNVTFIGSGLPTATAEGVVTLTPSDPATMCAFDVKVDYFYKCEKFDIRGTYVMNTALNNTNYVEIIFDVAVAGSHPELTYTGGGMTFTLPAGTFNAGQNQVILFPGVGMPTATGIITLVPSNSSTMCQGEVTVAPAAAGYACNAASATPIFNGPPYHVGTPLTAANTMSFSINVSVIGNHPAITYTGEGMTFTAPAGSFTTTGNQNIILTGSGTPTAGGAIVLDTLDPSLCKTSITVGYGNAVFTCIASPVGNILGNYLVGVPLTTANKFDITYNVTTLGNYNSLTLTGGGMTFTAPAGTFTSTGQKVVTFEAYPINASNTPTTAGSNTLTGSGSPAGCTIAIPVNQSFAYSTTCTPTSPAISTFQFTQGVAIAAGTTFTIPLTVVGTGDIPSFTATTDGLTLTTTAITGATAANTSLTVTITGTPTANGTSTITITLPVSLATCSYTFNVTPTFSYSYTCGSTNPALSTFNLTQGTAIAAGQTFTIPLSVLGTGAIPSFTGSASGITLTTTAIPTATSSNNTLTVTISGNPTANGSIIVPITINGVSCNYTFSVKPAFAYTYTCGSTNPTLTTFNYTQGTAISSTGQTFTIPLSVVGSGSIPVFTGSNNGITLTTTAIPTATSSNNTLTVTISGTPTASGSIVVPIIINGVSCNYTFNVSPAFSTTYSCGASTPAAGTRIFTVGTAASGTFTVPVTVTGTGNIPSITNISNGITYTTDAISNATSGTTAITVRYTGTPTAAGSSSFVLSSSCTYSHTVNAAFSYTYNCAGVTIDPTMVRGVDNSGTVTVPVTVTGIGNIPAINTTINNVLYSYLGTTGATSAITFITINYSGAPNTDATTLPLTSSNGASCNVSIPHPYGNAVFTGCSTAVAGAYQVEKALDGTNYLTVTFTGITKPGYVNLTSADVNGMKFSSNGNKLITDVTPGTTNVVRMDPIAAASKLFTIAGASVPNTSEDVTNGANGSNDQKTSLAITNSLGSSPSCPALIDVKMKVITMTGLNDKADTYGVPQQKTLVGSADSRIQMEINRVGKATWYFWNVMIRNQIASDFSFTARSTASWDNIARNMNGTVASNLLAGSFDPYRQTEGAAPRSSGDLDVGAHAGSEDALAQEISESGFNVLIGGKYYKYRIIYNSLPGGLTTNLVLYGIHNASPQLFQTKIYSANGTGKDANPPYTYNP